MRASPAVLLSRRETPLDHPLAAQAVAAALRTCRALPGLRGFVGVDLVLTDGRRRHRGQSPAHDGVSGRAFGTREGNVAALALAACAGVCRHRRRSAERPLHGVGAVVRTVRSRPVWHDRRGRILGWDVGGANIKWLRIERRSTVRTRRWSSARSRSGASPDALPAAALGDGERLAGRGTMAVTMTAELADCFATKREGVASCSTPSARRFPAPSLVYGVDGRFRSTADARQQPLSGGRQLDGERDPRGAHVSGCALHRRRQHDHRRDSDRRRPRRRARPHRSRTARAPASSSTRARCERRSAPWFDPCRCAAGRCRVAAEHFRGRRPTCIVAGTDRRKRTTRARRPTAGAAAGLRRGPGSPAWCAPIRDARPRDITPIAEHVARARCGRSPRGSPAGDAAARSVGSTPGGGRRSGNVDRARRRRGGRIVDA